MEKPITYVGLDVHKETIAVAVAAADKRGEVREYGTIANTQTALKALAGKLAKSGTALHFCYEAGPCGYGIQRQLSAAGHASPQLDRFTAEEKLEDEGMSKHCRIDARLRVEVLGDTDEGQPLRFG